MTKKEKQVENDILKDWVMRNKIITDLELRLYEKEKAHNATGMLLKREREKLNEIVRGREK